MIDKKNFLYMEWIITFGCNYSCNYCFFRDNLQKYAFMYKNRGPKLPKNKVEKIIFSAAKMLGIFQYADSFKNYEMSKWLTMFTELSKQKQQIYLSFTGGEPLIDYKKIEEVIKHLENCFEEVMIRIDTNGSKIPDFDESIKKYITYNVSYHPSQTAKNTLIENLKKLDTQGKVLMVNRVISQDELSTIDTEVDEFKKHGYFLNINPANFEISKYTENDMTILTRYKAAMDFNYPLYSSTIGKSCDYPQFGLQLLPNGYAWIPPCDDKTVIDLINKPFSLNELLKQKPLSCPTKCVCFHQYPWVEDGYQDIDIMKNYVDRNIEHRTHN